MPATINQISKAMKVSEIRFKPVVVNSETAMTLTMAECLISEIKQPGQRRQDQRHGLRNDDVKILVEGR